MEPQKSGDSNDCMDPISDVSELQIERPTKRRRLEGTDFVQSMQIEATLPSSPIGSGLPADTAVDHPGSPAMSESDDKENLPPYYSSSSGIFGRKIRGLLR